MKCARNWRAPAIDGDRGTIGTTKRCPFRKRYVNSKLR